MNVTVSIMLSHQFWTLTSWLTFEEEISFFESKYMRMRMFLLDEEQQLGKMQEIVN